MKKVYVIKKWSANDYWNYLKNEKSKAFNDSTKNIFIGGTVEEAKLFTNIEEAEKELDNYLMEKGIFQIELIYKIN